MLSPDRLTLAIDIHLQSYTLLRWVAMLSARDSSRQHVLTNTQILRGALIGLTNTT